MVLYRRKQVEKAAASKRTAHFKLLDVVRYPSRTDVGLCCAVSRALVQQHRRGRLWAVLEFRYVGENCRATTLRRSKFYVWLCEVLGTGEKEELMSDSQEQQHIDGAG